MRFRSEVSAPPPLAPLGSKISKKERTFLLFQEWRFSQWFSFSLFRHTPCARSCSALSKNQGTSVLFAAHLETSPVNMSWLEQSVIPGQRSLTLVEIWSPSRGRRCIYNNIRTDGQINSFVCSRTSCLRGIQLVAVWMHFSTTTLGPKIFRKRQSAAAQWLISKHCLATLVFRRLMVEVYTNCNRLASLSKMVYRASEGDRPRISGWSRSSVGRFPLAMLIHSPRAGRFRSVVLVTITDQHRVNRTAPWE